MTLRDWLAQERQPEYSGINARQTLRNMVAPRGRAIDRKITLNAVSVAVRRLGEAIAA